MPFYETLLRHALALTLWTTLPVVLTALVGGLLVGVFQSLTQLNDSTFSLAPRLAAALLVAFLLGGWMLAQDAALARELIGHLSQLIDRSWS
ncbi:MAG TPA: flagellar biosynthetic protein FliQ [Gammaproteobacteria bacterium]|nr:flagellar biosynthetic protein FliQ [Gammaproteobacteria bacterium]